MNTTTLSTTRAAGGATGGGWRRPPLPMPLLLIAGGLIAAMLAAPQLSEVPARFGAHFGRAAADFSLIIIPSFVIATCLAASPSLPALGRLATVLSPASGAGMVCPDTAYSVLAPASGGYRLHTAFGSYAGFKLIAPAGPLIVATGLGLGASTHVLLVAAAFALPALASGWWWASRFAPAITAQSGTVMGAAAAMRGSAPFLVLGGALALPLTPWSGHAVASLLAKPQGALLAAACAALVLTAPAQRRGCIDDALRRSAALLLLIGSAAAVGGELVALLAQARRIAELPTGAAAALAAFAVAAVVKSLQGSSMVTFATVTPLLAPLLPATGLPPAAAVVAVCLGSFAVLLPNDSYYWLVRTDALAAHDEPAALRILAGGSLLQALSGLALLVLALQAGWL